MATKVMKKSIEPNIADLANGWLKSYKLDYKLEQEDLNTEIDINDMVITYSPFSYAYEVLSSETTEDGLKNLVKAMYLYNRAAVAYMNA